MGPDSPQDPTLAPLARVSGGHMAIVQLPVVVAVWGIAGQFGLAAGVMAVVACAVVWPPRVPWRPMAARAVLATYLPFAVVWLAFTIVYLRAAHECGATVAPQPQLVDMARAGLAEPGSWLLLLGIVVVAPVLEEIVFRGYLFTALDVVLPRWATQLATAVLFGLAHGAAYALPIGVLALFFGWVRARHGSLLPSILAHAVHNGLTVAVTLLWPGHLELLYPR